MTVLVGTSGHQYGFWRGHFFPDECREADMLGHCAARLPSVEINDTFYRTPRREVPDSFRFAIKASRRITHISRSKEVTSPVGLPARQPRGARRRARRGAVSAAAEAALRRGPARACRPCAAERRSSQHTCRNRR